MRELTVKDLHARDDVIRMDHLEAMAGEYDIRFRYRSQDGIQFDGQEATADWVEIILDDMTYFGHTLREAIDEWLDQEARKP